MNSRVPFWLLACSVIATSAAALTTRHLLLTNQKAARAVGVGIPIQTLPARVQSVGEIIGGAGAIEPSMPITITNKVVSKVLRVPVDEGSVVRAGALLVEFDARVYRANLETAKANFEHWHRQVGRLRRLKKTQLATAVEVEEAIVAQARAREILEGAKFDLANTRIYSPVAGIVLKRSVNPGEMGRLDESIMQVGVINPVLMTAAITEDKIGHVYLGMDAEVGTDAFPGELFQGTVAKIERTVDPAPRSFSVSVRIENRDLRLHQGVTGYARLKGARMALAVPSTAIMNSVGDMPATFVVDPNGRAHLRPVRIGLSSGGMTELLSGVQEGDEIVVVGQAGLRDGDRVRANRNAPWNES